MKKTMKLHPLTSAIALISSTAILPQAVVAQDQAKEEEVLVVSARRRDETLQEVPISLSSFSGDALEKSGTPDIVQLGSSVPNTTLKVSRGTNTTLTAFIRGVGQQDPVAGFEAGVGIYIDDIYLNRPQGAVLDVYDVERIEILRGPQGTLYGRNTIGGAIKYVTKRLSDETELSIKGSFGTYNQTDLVVTGSMPVAGDSVKIGGTIATFQRDGFGENVATGEEHYDKDITAARLSAEFTPNDDLFIRLAADTSIDKSSPKSGHRLVADPATLDPSLPSIDDLDVYDTRGTITEIGHPVNKNEMTASGYSAAIEYSLSDALTFKSITAFREDETESPIDFDSLPGALFDVVVEYENEQLSQEFQFVFEGERVQGLAGLYYLDANAFNAFDVILSASNITSFTIGDVDTETWAVFADVNFDLSDTLNLALGARYTEDKRTSTVTREAFSPGTNGLVSPYFGGNGTSTTSVVTDDNGNEVVPTFTGSRTDSDFTPKVSISWQPGDEVHLYASYSKGFKGGGFDPRGDYSQEVVRDGFGPETVDSYEIGLKSNALDGLIASNLAIFYSDYKDVQIPSSIGIDNDNDGIIDNFVGATTNAAVASIIGAELDVTANFTDNLSSVLTIGLIDAKYDEYIGSAGTDISSSQVFQNSPDATASLAMSYEIPVGPGELSLLGSANYTSLTYQFGTPTPGLDQPGYTLVNASAVWNSDDDHWQVGLHALNVNDKEYKVAGYVFPGLTTAFYGNPRTVTATVKYQF